jgi:hypothetical protein
VARRVVRRSRGRLGFGWEVDAEREELTNGDEVEAERELTVGMS